VVNLERYKNAENSHEKRVSSRWSEQYGTLLHDMAHVAECS